jgi:hypothetical protein
MTGQQIAALDQEIQRLKAENLVLRAQVCVRLMFCWSAVAADKR